MQCASCIMISLILIKSELYVFLWVLQSTDSRYLAARQNKRIEQSDMSQHKFVLLGAGLPRTGTMSTRFHTHTEYICIYYIYNNLWWWKVHIALKWSVCVQLCKRNEICLVIYERVTARAALRELLGGDVYHMMSVAMDRPDHHHLWRKALAATITKLVCSEGVGAGWEVRLSILQGGLAAGARGLRGGGGLPRLSLLQGDPGGLPWRQGPADRERPCQVVRERERLHLEGQHDPDILATESSLLGAGSVWGEQTPLWDIPTQQDWLYSR